MMLWCRRALRIAQMTSTFYDTDNSVLWSSSTCWCEMSYGYIHKPSSSYWVLIYSLYQTEGGRNSEPCCMIQYVREGFQPCRSFSMLKQMHHSQKRHVSYKDWLNNEPLSFVRSSTSYILYSGVGSFDFFIIFPGLYIIPFLIYFIIHILLSTILFQSSICSGVLSSQWRKDPTVCRKVDLIFSDVFHYWKWNKSKMKTLWNLFFAISFYGLLNVDSHWQQTPGALFCNKMYKRYSNVKTIVKKWA